MIKLDVFEPSKGQPIKTIYFSDQHGWCFRVASFLEEKLVLDELKEFSETKQIVSETLFNSNYEVIAYKNYLKDSAGKIIGTEDFEMIDGQLKKLNTIFFEIINEDDNYMKQIWHNNLSKLVYTFETSDKFDFRYVKPNGEVVDSDELHDFLQAYKPREFIEIGNEYLNRIVKENT
ncbi:hypothetical protein [Acinetobacter sp. TUM15071]|uniref:hypothetical protein n=1 Tax=Acinetobacter sp. TUM15071 TaxID=2609135 RepID=UPI00124D9D07|nr:hypothetical protein [Acinetobacter sp. TUM15071]